MGQVMFQRLTETGFSTVQEGICRVCKVFYRVERLRIHRTIEYVLNLIKQIALSIYPTAQDFVRFIENLIIRDTEYFIINLAGQ